MGQSLFGGPDRLRILHCFRSPVGGIFRHVKDLIHQQVKWGHSVGVICDNNTGGPFEEALLSDLEPCLELGLYRIPMDRSVGPQDLLVMKKLYGQIRDIDADVLHSHGAKGGVYARFIGTLLRRGSKRPARLYCPHGGSIHYDHKTLAGRFYFGAERILERFTDRLIFVSRYEQDTYFDKVGQSACPYSLARNGLKPEEFVPVKTHEAATDFLYIGMMRDLKGVDLLLDAFPIVAKRLSRPISATMVGDGPDLARYKQVASKFGDDVNITFHDPMPARQAFELGHTVIVPSRAESMPYVVLEALAAKRPILATRVGGIPEIFAESAGALIGPDNLDQLSTALAGHLSGTRKAPDFDLLHAQIKDRFSVETMTDSITQAYQDTVAGGSALRAVTQ